MRGAVVGAQQTADIFPPCKAELREYFDYKATRAHMARMAHHRGGPHKLFQKVADKNELVPSA